MSTMRAIQATEIGGPEVLLPAQLPVPEPGQGQLLVRTHAVGVNFVDTYVRSGRYPAVLPYVPGQEGAGEVVALGSAVSGFAVGDPVVWSGVPGSYAEYVAVPADKAVVIPASVSYEVAASSFVKGLTAHFLLYSSYAAKPGDTVLLHAGAGGVGLILTQLAVAKGVRVITTASTPEKAALSRAAGAEHVLAYGEGLALQVRELTHGEGVAAAYDGVGKDTFESSLAATRVRGVVVLFGGASGLVPPFQLQRLSSSGSQFVTRPTLADYVRTRAELEWRANAVLSAVERGIVKVSVSKRYALADAGQAHRDLEGRLTSGSVVLDPNR